MSGQVSQRVFPGVFVVATLGLRLIAGQDWIERIRSAEFRLLAVLLVAVHTLSQSLRNYTLRFTARGCRAGQNEEGIHNEKPYELRATDYACGKDRAS